MKQEQKQVENKEILGFLEKIVVDVGVGRASTQPNFAEKVLPQIEKDLGLIAGQKSQQRPAKKSIAGFKVRGGQTVGLKITLRRRKMVDFFARLIKIVLPRVKDFGGIGPTQVDDGGTLNIGIREQYVFPEIVPEQSPTAFSLGVSIVPRVRHREEAIKRYRELGVPLKR